MYRGKLFKANELPKSVLSECFNGRDKQLFLTALTGKPAAHGLIVSRCRSWVTDVIHLWVDKIEIPFSLGVQVVFTGDTQAVQRHWRRKLTPLEASRAEVLKIPDETFRQQKLQELNKKLEEVHQVSGWDLADLNSWLREHWVFALTLTPPTMRVHTFSGKLEAAPKTARPKVGETTTTTKRPRSKGKRQDNVSDPK